MSRTIRTFALILLYFLACGKSCDNQEQSDAEMAQRQVRAESDSLRAAFGSDTLTASTLQAYEETAVLKFADYCDYLMILADSTAAEPFRAKAREATSGMFISESSMLRYPKPAGIARSACISARIDQPLQRACDSVYTGKLRYFSSFHEQQSEKNMKQDRFEGTACFLVLKHQKKFGPDTMKVWEVFLGDPE
ncbi:MAG: hypothetical protein NT040_01635 [Bacteroidetes bacterium]|nr:hypothetical protein [Bacteroidota bacterium]